MMRRVNSLLLQRMESSSSARGVIVPATTTLPITSSSNGQAQDPVVSRPKPVLASIVAAAAAGVGLVAVPQSEGNRSEDASLSPPPSSLDLVKVASAVAATLQRMEDVTRSTIAATLPSSFRKRQAVFSLGGILAEEAAWLENSKSQAISQSDSHMKPSTTGLDKQVGNNLGLLLINRIRSLGSMTGSATSVQEAAEEYSARERFWSQYVATATAQQQTTAPSATIFPSFSSTPPTPEGTTAPPKSPSSTRAASWQTAISSTPLELLPVLARREIRNLLLEGRKGEASSPLYLSVAEVTMLEKLLKESEGITVDLTPSQAATMQNMNGDPHCNPSSSSSQADPGDAKDRLKNQLKVRAAAKGRRRDNNGLIRDAVLQSLKSTRAGSSLLVSSALKHHLIAKLPANESLLLSNSSSGNPSLSPAARRAAAAATATTVAQKLGVQKIFFVRFIIEAGSFDTNGIGKKLLAASGSTSLLLSKGILVYPIVTEMGQQDAAVAELVPSLLSTHSGAISTAELADSPAVEDLIAKQKTEEMKLTGTLVDDLRTQWLSSAERQRKTDDIQRKLAQQYEKSKKLQEELMVKLTTRQNAARAKMLESTPEMVKAKQQREHQVENDANSPLGLAHLMRKVHELERSCREKELLVNQLNQSKADLSQKLSGLQQELLAKERNAVAAAAAAAKQAAWAAKDQSALSHQLSALKMKNVALEQNAKEIDGQLRLLTAEKKRLAAALQELQALLDKERGAVAERVAELQAEKIAAQNQIDNLESQNESQRSLANQLECALKDQLVEMKMKDSDNAQHKKRVHDLEERLAESMKTSQQHQADHQAAATQHVEAEGKLQRYLEALRAEVSTLKTMNGELSISLSDAHLEHEKKEAALVKQFEEEARRQVTESKKQTEERLAAAAVDLTAVETELAEAQRRALEMARRSTVDSINQQQQSEVALKALQAEIQILSESKNMSEDQLKKSQHEHRALMAAQAAGQDAFAQSAISQEAELSFLKDSLEAKNTALEDAERQLRGLEATHRDAVAAMAEKADFDASVQSADIERIRRQSEEEISKLNATVIDLNTSCDDLKRQVQRSEADIEQFNADRSALQEQLVHQQQITWAVEGKLESTLHEKNNQELLFQGKVEKLENDISEAKEGGNKLSLSYREAEKALDATTKALKAAEEKLLSLEDQMRCSDSVEDQVTNAMAMLDAQKKEANAAQKISDDAWVAKLRDQETDLLSLAQAAAAGTGDRIKSLEGTIMHLESLQHTLTVDRKTAEAALQSRIDDLVANSQALVEEHLAAKQANDAQFAADRAKQESDRMDWVAQYTQDQTSLDELASQLEVSRGAEADLQGACIELQARLEQSESRTATLLQKHSADFGPESAELQSQLAAQQSTIRQHVDREAALLKEREVLSSDLQLAKQVSAPSVPASTLSAGREQEMATEAELCAELGRVKKEKEVMVVENQQLTKKLRELAQTTSSNDNGVELASLRARLISVEAQKDATESETKRLEQVEATLHTTVIELRSQLLVAGSSCQEPLCGSTSSLLPSTLLRQINAQKITIGVMTQVLLVATVFGLYMYDKWGVWLLASSLKTPTRE